MTTSNTPQTEYIGIASGDEWPFTYNPLLPSYINLICDLLSSIIPTLQNFSCEAIPATLKSDL
jgi:hypothetical protein